jgi:hypothetical protein
MGYRYKLIPTYEVRILTPEGTVSARVALVPADLRQALEGGLPSERMLVGIHGGFLQRSSMSTPRATAIRCNHSIVGDLPPASTSQKCDAETWASPIS